MALAVVEGAPRGGAAGVFGGLTVAGGLFAVAASLFFAALLVAAGLGLSFGAEAFAAQLVFAGSTAVGLAGAFAAFLVAAGPFLGLAAHFRILPGFFLFATTDGVRGQAFIAGDGGSWRHSAAGGRRVVGTAANGKEEGGGESEQEAGVWRHGVRRGATWRDAGHAGAAG